LTSPRVSPPWRKKSTNRFFKTGLGGARSAGNPTPHGRSNCRRARAARVTRSDLSAIGITNQRETTVLWERKTGKPVANAIVWQDTRVAEDVARFAREGGQDRFRQQTGLPLSTYFSSLKLRWLLENIPGAREKAAAGELLFGNIDTFLLWNLTGGPQGGVHVTDVTNASRTQLLNLITLDWDEKLLERV